MDKSIIANYAELGYQVLPLAPGEKKPLSRLVPNGLKNATTDLSVISSWLSNAPDANVGILPPENVLVLDFDNPEAWRGLLERYPALSACPRQRTPSGGYHVFMRIPGAGVGKITTSVRLMEGVDIRGLGKAYVATAPSKVNGASYVWEVPLVPPDELPEIPAGLLLELIEAAQAKKPQPPVSLPPRTVQADEATAKKLNGLLRWACERVAAARVGERHNTLRNYACLVGGWLHYGLDFDTAHQALYEAAIKTGLPSTDAWRTARDGLQYGMENPLPLPETTQAALAYLDWVRGEVGGWDKPEECPTHPLEGLSGGLLLADGRPQYVVRNGVIHRGVIRSKNGETEVLYVPLCTFSAVIRRVIEDTDGQETTLTYEIEGYLDDGTPLPPVQVPAAEFASLEWVRKSWGPSAAISGDPGAERHIRAAIEFLSRSRFKKTKIYRHTGWARVDGHWCYLHAGGAIGEHGGEEIRVELPSRLAGFALPEPPSDPNDEIEAHLELLALAEEVAPPRIAIPLILYALSAPLGRAPYPLYLAGATMAGKTTLAMLVQSAFAPGLELPAQSWSSTANALEGAAFALKDSLLLIDDFAPGSSRFQREDLQAKAEQIIRAQTSGAGRSRLRSDGRLKGDRPPRGNLIITGEDLPHTHSIRNRTLFLEVRRGDVNFSKASRAQALARKGVYARAMASWIRWLAPRLDEVKERFEARIEELRTRWKGVHNRTATAMAHLQATWEIYAEYLKSIGLEFGEATHKMVEDVLGAVASWQEEADKDADPVERFPELLQALFASGRAHLQPLSNSVAPEEYMANPAAWGWRFRITGRYRDEGTGELRVTGVWEPQGRVIGWVGKYPEGEGIYLIPDIAWVELNRLAAETGASLPSKRALLLQLAHAGLIETKMEGENVRPTVVKRIGGRLVRVIHVLPKALFYGEDPGNGPLPPYGGPSEWAPATPECDESPGSSPSPAPTAGAHHVPEPGGRHTAEPQGLEPASQAHGGGTAPEEPAREVDPEPRTEDTAMPTTEEDADPDTEQSIDTDPDTEQSIDTDPDTERAIRMLELLVKVFDARPVSFVPKNEKIAEAWAKMNRKTEEPTSQAEEKPPPEASIWDTLAQKVPVLAKRIRGLGVRALEARADGQKVCSLDGLSEPIEEALTALFRRAREVAPKVRRVEVYAIEPDKKPWRVVEILSPKP